MLNLLLFALASGLASGQQSDAPQTAQAEPCKALQHAPSVPSADASEHAAKRENSLGPANYAEACHEYDRAYQLYLQVMDLYPEDARVLMMTAQAAVTAERLEEAIPLFRRLLAMGGRCSWSNRASLMKVYISLGRWPEFEELRMGTRKASLAGDQCLPIKDGYPIDQLSLADEYVRVMEFPALP